MFVYRLVAQSEQFVNISPNWTLSICQLAKWRQRFSLQFTVYILYFLYNLQCLLTSTRRTGTRTWMASGLTSGSSTPQTPTGFPEVSTAQNWWILYWHWRIFKLNYKMSCWDERTGDGAWETFTAIMIYGKFQCSSRQCGKCWTSRQVQVDMQVTHRHTDRQIDSQTDRQSDS